MEKFIEHLTLNGKKTAKLSTRFPSGRAHIFKVGQNILQKFYTGVSDFFCLNVPCKSPFIVQALACNQSPILFSPDKLHYRGTNE